MQNAELDDSQTGIKIARRNINNLRYANNTTLMAESEKRIKSILMRVNKENEKASLKLNIQKTKIMASGPITSWWIDEDKVEAVTVLLSLAPKSLWTVTVEMKVKDACSLEERYATLNVLESRDLTFLTKVYIVRAIMFPVVK